MLAVVERRTLQLAAELDRVRQPRLISVGAVYFMFYLFFVFPDQLCAAARPRHHG